ncbi:unnamed protein product [Clonostachys rosea]|uniref:Fucose-specific lectin n=1 Tax=Bionectria ochroleuca TaxID=29856 RepID=A0ABY6U4D4_BIOOC|nr:unnamed protein product [Clonostachys rosea]
MPEEQAAQHVAFSAIRNPANPDRVFIYRVAPKDNTLSYEQRAIHKGVSAPRWNKNPNGKGGVPSTTLNGTSNIVTLIFDDVVQVFGVSATTGYLSLISPFVEPLEPKVDCIQGKLAGVVFTEHDEEQAWLVYEGKEGNGDNAEPKLMYCDVTTPETPDTASSAKDIKKGTGLSLFHDTRRCWVIFQNKSGQLVAHNEKDQKPSVISPDTAHFGEKTPIASCFIPAKEIDTNEVPGFRSDALGRVIVYWVRYFNGKPRLYRSHADLTEKSSSAEFSEPRQATENGVAVEPLGQISVVVNPSTQSNYLFVAKHGGDNISSVTDNWATKHETSSQSLDMASTELFKKWQARILEEAVLGRGLGNGGFADHRHPHHIHERHQNGHSNGHSNGERLIDEEMLEKFRAKLLLEEIMGEDTSERRITNGTKRNLPLTWRNEGDDAKPQIHSGVITRKAHSQWSEAEVQVLIPAGSTIMGDVIVQLKVRPTD